MDFYQILDTVFKGLKSLFLYLFTFLNETILFIHKHLINFQIWLITKITPENYLGYFKLLSVPNIYTHTLHNFLYTLIFNFSKASKIENTSDQNQHALTPDKKTFTIWALIYFLLLIYVISYTPLIIKYDSLYEYYKLQLINSNLITNRNWIEDFTRYDPNFHSSYRHLIELKNNLEDYLIPAQKYIVFKKILKLYNAWGKIAILQNDIIKRIKNNENQNLAISEFLKNNYDDNQDYEGLVNFLKLNSSQVDRIELYVYLWAVNGIFINFKSDYFNNPDHQNEDLNYINMNIQTMYDNIKTQLIIAEDEYQLGNIKFNQFLYLSLKEIILNWD